VPAAGALFDDASAARLGPGAVLALADGLLSISLSPRSSLAPGDVLIVAQRPGAPALVDAASGAPFANGALAAVAASPGTPPPTATIAGPSTVGGVCPGGSVSVGGAAFDASGSRAGVRAAAVAGWAADAAGLAAAADAAGSSPVLRLSAATIASLPVGTHVLRVTVRGPGGDEASAEFSVARAAAAVPALALPGATDGALSFLVGAPLRLRPTLAPGGCPGAAVVWGWGACAACGAPAPPGLALPAATRDLVLGGVDGVVGAITGEAYGLALTASYAGGDTAATLSLRLVATASPLTLTIAGPAGDVNAASALAWRATVRDPDEGAVPVAARFPVAFAWRCLVAATPSSPLVPCSIDPISLEDDGAGRFSLAPGALAPLGGGGRDRIEAAATRGAGRTAVATVDILPKDVPAGTILPAGSVARVCGPARACRERANPSAPLRLEYAPGDAATTMAAAAGTLIYSWTCDDGGAGACPSLAAPRVAAAARVLLVPATDAAGAPALPDGGTLTFSVTVAPAGGGANATASAAVAFARRPACADPAACLVASPPAGDGMTTSFVLTTGPWLADGGVAGHEFGVVRADGSRAATARGVADRTFSLGTLPPSVGGAMTTVYACATDAAGGSACATARVAVGPPPPDFAVDAAALAAAATAAAASGDADAALAAAQAITAAAAEGGGGAALDAARAGAVAALAAAAGSGAALAPEDALALVAAVRKEGERGVGGARSRVAVARARADAPPRCPPPQLRDLTAGAPLPPAAANAALTATAAALAAAAAGGADVAPADLADALAVAASVVAARGPPTAAGAAAAQASVDALASTILGLAYAGLSVGEPAVEMAAAGVRTRGTRAGDSRVRRPPTPSLPPPSFCSSWRSSSKRHPPPCRAPPWAAARTRPPPLAACRCACAGSPPAAARSTPRPGAPAGRCSRPPPQPLSPCPPTWRPRARPRASAGAASPPRSQRRPTPPSSPPPTSHLSCPAAPAKR